MPACASQPTAFSLPSAACSPLSSNSSAGGSKHLRYPPASSHGALPVRPERHVPHSIASIRRELTVKLVRTLPRCPCCLRQRRELVNEKKTQEDYPDLCICAIGAPPPPVTDPLQDHSTAATCPQTEHRIDRLEARLAAILVRSASG